MKHALVVLGMAGALGAAETVDAVSAAFSFPASTAAVKAARSPASPALTCRVAGATDMLVKWSGGAEGSESTLAVRRLDGRTVVSRSLRGASGVVSIDGLAAGVYLFSLTIEAKTHTTRVAVGAQGRTP
ncbi:MAG: hypothetical protein GF331_16295 [Chitinivibrionales bacterium]|nr:hypothetical protein [Chitinivibrionales bacterium]